MRDRLRRALRTHATRPPLRWLAEPVYDAAVRAELALAAKRDARARREEADLSDVTAIVKTFERPRVLRRLLASLRRVYPELAVLVVDDGREPAGVAGDGIRVLRMPYDVGLSAGRNAALAETRTELFFLLDDDFVLTTSCGLERVARVMRAHPRLDIVGGQVLTLPTFRRDVGPENRDFFGGWPEREAEIGGLPTYDRVANFFVARTKRVAAVGWDPKLKLLEHTDFFRRAHKRLLVAFDERLRCLHAMTPFDVDYMKHRNDIARYRAYLDLKWR
jgi:glycosyltransferase involved in cell wall biosynthesis